MSRLAKLHRRELAWFIANGIDGITRTTFDTEYDRVEANASNFSGIVANSIVVADDLLKAGWTKQ